VDVKDGATVLLALRCELVDVMLRNPSAESRIDMVSRPSFLVIEKW
jgi:hypothetical protein